MPELVSDIVGHTVYPVHRLDQGTGGVMILTFSPRICASLQKQFQLGQVKKQYLAAVSGKPAEASGAFADYLFHDRTRNKTYVVKRPRSGVKKAECEWSSVHSALYADETVSLIRVLLHTGRTHQIRVQFASRGFPLIGDRKYGSRIASDTPALWAERICFTHPCFEGKIIDVCSSPPDVFPWILFSKKD